MSINLPLYTNVVYHEDPSGERFTSNGEPILCVTENQIRAYAQQQSQQMLNDFSRELAEKNHILEEMKQKEKDLSSALYSKQNELNAANNTICRMKTSSLNRYQYLSNLPDPVPGLYLITTNPNKGSQHSQLFATVWLKEIVKVHSNENNYYFAIKFSLNNLTDEFFAYIPEDIWGNNVKLLTELSKYGISTCLDIPISKKAALFRDYFLLYLRKSPLVFEEDSLGWNVNKFTYKYITPYDLPWWNRNLKVSVVTEPSNLFHSTLSSLKSLLEHNISPEIKFLRMLPYATKLLPLLSKLGCTGDANVNLVVPDLSAMFITSLNQILDSDNFIDLPLKDKALSAKLSSIKKGTPLFRVKYTELTMAEKSQLERNIQTIKAMYLGISIPVIISPAPLLVNDNGTIVIECDEENHILGCTGNFKVTEQAFHSYLNKNAVWIANKIQIKKIPVKYGELGISYELFFITQKVLSNFCKEYLGEPVEYYLEWLKDFYKKQVLNTDTDSISLMFLHCLETAVERSTVTCIAPYDTLTEYAVIVSDSEVYFRKDTFKKILSEYISGYSPLNILQSLFRDGYLIADVGKKVNFTTRRKCTHQDGETSFDKFVVLNKNKVIAFGDFDYLSAAMEQ